MENYINSQNQFQPSMGNAGRIFNYNGNNVTMRMQNGTVYVNLTEFAKPFPDKNLSTIINSKGIREYITMLCELKNLNPNNLLQITRGGNKSGTWAHQKVAIRIAQKLSTAFSIWVDDKIEELLTTNISISRECNLLVNNASLLYKNTREYMTYIISDNHGLFKIGRSSDIWKRISTLETANPDIKLICVINKDIESELHGMFDTKRYHGEWFKLSNEDLQQIFQIIPQEDFWFKIRKYHNITPANV